MQDNKELREIENKIKELERTRQQAIERARRNLQRRPRAETRTNANRFNQGTHSPTAAYSKQEEEQRRIRRERERAELRDRTKNIGRSR